MLTSHINHRPRTPRRPPRPVTTTATSPPRALFSTAVGHQPLSTSIAPRGVHRGHAFGHHHLSSDSNSQSDLYEVLFFIRRCASDCSRTRLIHSDVQLSVRVLALSGSNPSGTKSVLKLLCVVLWWGDSIDVCFRLD